MQPNRRDFFGRSALIALTPTVPGFLARTARAARAERDGRVLIVIQLDGGNDGINTVVPFADDGYAKHRKLLRLPTPQLIKVNDRVGLHPSMTGAGSDASPDTIRQAVALILAMPEAQLG